MKKILLLITIVTITLNGVSQTWSEVIKLVASDREENDSYAANVCINEYRAILGNNPNYNGSMFGEIGSAYIFELIGDEWIQTAKLHSSDAEKGDGFGINVSISGDKAIVGAPLKDGEGTLYDAGSAYIFELIDGMWTQTKRLVSPDKIAYGGFGGSVSISDNICVVGAYTEDQDIPGAGLVYVYELNDIGEWTLVEKLVASDREEGDSFGVSVCINNNRVIVGAVDSGEAATGKGAAYIYELNGGVWSESAKLVPSDQGLFEDDKFGLQVCIDGEKAIVGATLDDHDANGGNIKWDTGSAYVFELKNNEWIQTAKLVASDREEQDNFGNSVSISRNRAVVGVPLKDFQTSDGDMLYSVGSVYVFELNGGKWEEVDKLFSSDKDEVDNFGNSVSISMDRILIGAFLEDENAENKNTLNNAGSAYVFEYITSIVDVENNKNISYIYPNPVNNMLAIQLTQVSYAKYIIFDFYGRKVKEGFVLSEEQELDVSNLSKGIYVLSIDDVKQKFVKE